MRPVLNRRQFIQRGAWAAAGVTLAGCRATPPKVSANQKLNIGMIGVANQGAYNLSNVAGENIVALCDVDDNYLTAAAQKFPQAKRYTDFRRLLDQRDIEAVVIAIPDHAHAVAAVWGLRSGRHVYCEKP
jgi:predicted dehydrogenase